MANEIDFNPLPTGVDRVCSVRHSDGRFWSFATEALEAYSAANVANYDLALAEDPEGFYRADMPEDAPAGTYTAYAYESAGPLTDDDVTGDLYTHSLVIEWEPPDAGPAQNRFPEYRPRRVS